MPRWAVSASPESSGSHRYLPAALRPRRTVRPSSSARKSSAPGRVPAHRARVGDLDPLDDPADDAALEAAAHHLDLGQLRH